MSSVAVFSVEQRKRDSRISNRNEIFQKVLIVGRDERWVIGTRGKEFSQSKISFHCEVIIIIIIIAFIVFVTYYSVQTFFLEFKS